MIDLKTLPNKDSESSRSSLAEVHGFSDAKSADTTAIPSISVPLSLVTLSLVIPPIATTGIETESAISLSDSVLNGCVSFYVDVLNTAPAPI